MIIEQFEKSQNRPGSTSQQKLEIGELDSYWLSGIQATNVRIIFPKDLPPSKHSSKPSSHDDIQNNEDSQVVENALEVEDLSARLQILPLMIGRVIFHFDAHLLGGTANGSIPKGSSSGPFEVEWEEIDLSKVQPLSEIVGVPFFGLASGHLKLEANEGLFSKASGSLLLKVQEMSIGDGKTKIKDILELPKAQLGELTIEAEAASGQLKLTKFAANGQDLEIKGDGKITIRQPWNDSNLDINVKFKFSDLYRNKNQIVKDLLGDPNSSTPGLIEQYEPKMKRAKRSDGFYGWRISGPMKRLRFEPSSGEPGARTRPTPGADGTSSTPRRRPLPGRKNRLDPVGEEQQNPEDDPSKRELPNPIDPPILSPPIIPSGDTPPN